ncbi:uncharacterized protein LOC135463081 isoform X2 [Liolophura sinensis]|uniref:uncharacterized protein LOC135463081 isoform X2 n=1 Tax=Liolophura sinensis TaxID=3198878 RepID=UPI003158AB21
MMWRHVRRRTTTKETSSVSILPSYSTVDTERGHNVTLPCNIKTRCPDSPQITWYKGQPGIGQRVFSINTAGKVLINSNYTGRVDREGQAGLVIISPDLGDTGNYSCEVLITVDIPPIDAGHVFLNVTTEQKVNCELGGRRISLGLAVLDTLAILLGVMLIFLSGQTGFVGQCAQADMRSPIINSRRNMSRVCAAHFRLCWMSLCLIGATVMWIHYTVRDMPDISNSIGTIGVVLSIVGVTICFLCQVHGIITWLQDRKDGLKEDVNPSARKAMLVKLDAI